VGASASISGTVVAAVLDGCDEVMFRDAVADSLRSMSVPVHPGSARIARASKEVGKVERCMRPHSTTGRGMVPRRHCRNAEGGGSGGGRAPGQRSHEGRQRTRVSYDSLRSARHLHHLSAVFAGKLMGQKLSGLGQERSEMKIAKRAW